MQKTWLACSLAFWLIWICQFPLNHWIALHTSWWDCVSSGNIITWSNRCDICIQPGSCKTMENSPQPRWHSWLTTKISRLATIFERSSSIIWCRCWFSRWSCPCLSFPPTGPMHTDHLSINRPEKNFFTIISDVELEPDLNYSFLQSMEAVVHLWNDQNAARNTRSALQNLTHQWSPFSNKSILLSSSCTYSYLECLKELNFASTEFTSSKLTQLLALQRV